MVEVAGVRSGLVWFPSRSSLWEGGHCDSSRAVVDIPEMVTSVRIPLGAGQRQRVQMVTVVRGDRDHKARSRSSPV